MRTVREWGLVIALLVVAGPGAAQVGQRGSEARGTLREQRAALERYHAELSAKMHASAQVRHEDLVHERAMLEEQLAAHERHAATAVHEQEQRLRRHQRELDQEGERLRHEFERHLEGLHAHVAGLDATAFDAALDRLYGDGPVAPASPQDSADALWRQGREHLNAGRYREAVRAFSRIRTERGFANSQYRVDAHYWEAYALSRLGTQEDLEQARTVLEALLRFPAAQRTPDAEGLLVTVQSRLARLGSRAAEQALVASAIPLTTPVISQQADVARVVAERAQAVSTYSPLLAGQFAPPGEAWVPFATPEITWTTSGLLWAAGLPGSIPAQCRTDQEEIRMVALNALAQLDAASATPILREVMARRGECSEHLRRQALTIAARHRTPEVVDMLLEAARNDPDRIVRISSVQLLMTLDENRALTLIEEKLRNPSDTAGLREALAAAGGRVRTSDRAARLLLGIANRNDVPVSFRRDAIMGLGRHDNEETRRALRQLYRQTNERQLREAILSAAATGDMESVDWLLGIAADEQESNSVRRAALLRAARAKDVPAERFTALYDRFTTSEMKAVVIETLSIRARTERAATDKLLTIARSEIDTDLRKHAIVALSRSDDPRARELLLEILRR